MIVRWGLDALPGVLGELGISEPLLVTSERWSALDLPIAKRFLGVRPHAPIETVQEALAAAEGADGVVGVGGGSAIDTSKAVSAQSGLALVAVPTTYAGAEWTPFFGLRDKARRLKAGGSGAHTAGIVYEPRLTLDLPRAESCGTAMNALAHCAEALYTGKSNDAMEGAALIERWLPPVLEDGSDVEARTRLLEGAMHAGMAMRAGFFVGHAMAQALGGRYGLPHGALNAICLPAALRFNGPAVPQAIRLLGEAMGTSDPIGRVEELARLGGFTRLRDLGVPAEELAEVAEATAVRPGARANPRPVTAAEIGELLRSVW